MSIESDGPRPTQITLTYADEEWLARDEGTGLTGRGETRRAALAALDAAIDRADVDDSEVPADDPLFGGGSLFAADEEFDTSDVDDIVYSDPDA